MYKEKMISRIKESERKSSIEHDKAIIGQANLEKKFCEEYLPVEFMEQLILDLRSGRIYDETLEDYNKNIIGPAHAKFANDFGGVSVCIQGYHYGMQETVFNYLRNEYNFFVNSKTFKSGKTRWKEEVYSLDKSHFDISQDLISDEEKAKNTITFSYPAMAVFILSIIAASLIVFNMVFL